jgi:hypothetical protein
MDLHESRTATYNAKSACESPQAVTKKYEELHGSRAIRKIAIV